MARQTKDARIAELESRLARSEREYGACCEWFYVQGLDEPLVLDVGSTGIRVTVLGLQRASGGVAVVDMPAENRFQCAPEYLDDLAARWAADCSSEIREAARTLLQWRENACKVTAA